MTYPPPPPPPSEPQPGQEPDVQRGRVRRFRPLSMGGRRWIAFAALWPIGSAIVFVLLVLASGFGRPELIGDSIGVGLVMVPVLFLTAPAILDALAAAARHTLTFVAWVDRFLDPGDVDRVWREWNEQRRLR